MHWVGRQIGGYCTPFDLSMIVLGVCWVVMQAILPPATHTTLSVTALLGTTLVTHTLGRPDRSVSST